MGDWRERNRDPQIVVVQQITGHPEQLPTFEEIDYFALDYSTETIRATLGYLIDTGAVARVDGDSETFYGLTPEYREELVSNGFTKAESVLQEATLLTERPPEIDEKMKLDRPEWGPANPHTDGGHDE